MQMTMDFPAARRAPLPCGVRAKLMAQMDRRTALLHPNDEDAAVMANLIFGRWGQASTRHNYFEKPAVKAWLKKCRAEGLINRVERFGYFPTGDFNFEASHLGRKLSA